MHSDELLVNVERDAILLTRELAQSLVGYPYLFDAIVLAVSFSFHLRIFQECSDIYQTVGDEVDTVDDLFTYETYVQPEA